MFNRLHQRNKGPSGKSLAKGSDGFTIIEVLIVLAIAGLIMLIVFLAIPALQRNQRNQARNSEASRVATAVSECLGNRNGVVNSCSGENGVRNVQVGDMQRFSALTASNFAVGGSTPPTYSQDEVGVWFGKQCNEDGGLDSSDRIAVDSTTGPRTFVVVFQIESEIHRCISS